MRGKEIRLERIMNRNTKKTVIVPMDHGVTNGPIAGLIDMGQTVNLVADGGANAVIGHVGLALLRPPAGRAGHRAHPAPVGLHLARAGPEREGARELGDKRPEDGRRCGLDACQYRGRVRGPDALRSRARGGGVHGVGDAAPRDDVPAGEEHKEGERCRAGEALPHGWQPSSAPIS